MKNLTTAVLLALTLTLPACTTDSMFDSFLGKQQNAYKDALKECTNKKNLNDREKLSCAHTKVCYEIHDKLITAKDIIKGIETANSAAKLVDKEMSPKNKKKLATAKKRITGIQAELKNHKC